MYNPARADMTRAQRYRRQAEECLQLSERSSSPEQKASYLRMAQDWHQLALNAERAEAKKEGVQDDRGQAIGQDHPPTGSSRSGGDGPEHGQPK